MDSTPTLAQAIERYLKITSVRAAKTIHTYQYGLDKLQTYLEDELGRPAMVTDIENATASELCAALVVAGKAQQTVNTYSAAVMAFLRFALARDWLNDSFRLDKATVLLKEAKPNGEYRVKEVDPRIGEILPHLDSIAATIPILEHQRNAALAYLLATTGCRISEALSLNWDALRLDTPSVIGKRNKQRFLYPQEAALERIQLYLNKRTDAFEPLFISHGRDYGHRLCDVTARDMIRDAGKALGIYVTPHLFRHYFATAALNQGLALDEVQSLLGHASPATTKRVYAHRTDDALAHAARQVRIVPLSTAV